MLTASKEEALGLGLCQHHHGTSEPWEKGEIWTGMEKPGATPFWRMREGGAEEGNKGQEPCCTGGAHGKCSFTSW